MTARKYGKLHTAIHRNLGWRALDSDPQWLYMTLLSQPNVDSCGVLPLQILKWASCSASMTADRVRAALELLARAWFIVVDTETDEVLIRSFLEHDVLAAGSPKVLVGALRSALQVQSDWLRAVLASEAFRKASDRLSEGFLAESIKDLLKDLLDSLPDGYRKAIDSHPEGLFAFAFEEPPTQSDISSETVVVTYGGTSLARQPPLDRMGRPSMSFAALCGNPETAPPPPPAENMKISTETRALVRDKVPAEMLQSAKTYAGLCNQVQGLVNRGADMEPIAAVLDLWVGRKAAGEDIYPGHLEHIYAQHVASLAATPQQRRSGQKLSTSERNFLDLQGRRSKPTGWKEIASGS